MAAARTVYLSVGPLGRRIGRVRRDHRGGDRLGMAVVADLVSQPAVDPRRILRDGLPPGAKDAPGTGPPEQPGVVPDGQETGAPAARGQGHARPRPPV